MKKALLQNLWFLFFIPVVLFAGCTNNSGRQVIKFTKAWKFTLGDSVSYKDPDFDDSGWRVLNLPHDWSIEGQFSRSNPATPGGGALPGGIGWYRKSFYLSDSEKNKLIFIDFDGIYQKSEVWINGHYLGMRPYGYSSFRYDLTPYLNYGSGENLLAVRVNNSEQPNSRWYSGSGIYRNVWLVKTEKIFTTHWGTYITTPEVTNQNAKVHVETTLKNQLAVSADVTLKTLVFSPSGKLITQSQSTQNINPDDSAAFSQDLEISNPELWSIEHPQLYRAVSEVYNANQLTDRYETPFGIRYFKFDPVHGFSLNGKQVKILGVCDHHDLGCLGSAVNTRAIQRQLEILKAMGCNAIRTSHNPPAPELLDLCDKMGFIVDDEAFDMWRKRKTRYDYSRYFPEWHERDLSAQIMRDRNHPSVFMWSIGNEVGEQGQDPRSDTLSLQQADTLLDLSKYIKEDVINSGEMSVNSLLTIKLADIVKSLDPTRPVTAACNDPNPSNNLFKSGALDLYGFNYSQNMYANLPNLYPGKCLYSSESTSGLMTRGFYQMPSDSILIWPSWGRRGRPSGNPEQQCSSYDNCHVPWGATHEEAWKAVKKYDFMAGFFIWTGFDYLGEPTPYGWPSRSSYFGIIDMSGFPKDVYYMYQSEWTNKDVLHVFPRWNWKPGQLVDVWVYTNAEEVELFLNGKSLGTKSKQDGQLHLMWRVPFEPGTIRAVSRTGGKVILTREIKTAGPPAQLKATADRNRISADGEDLSFITVEVVDKDGTMVPDAGNQISFEVEGDAKIVGVDNGNPVSHESLKGSTIKAFNGKCLVVVQAGEKHGKIRLKASAEGIKDASVTIKSE